MSDANMKLSSEPHILSDNNNIQSTKRISAIVDMQFIQKMSEHNMTQTEAVVKGLEILFSDDYNNITSYKSQISSYERNIAILDAKLSEFETIKTELNRVRALLEDQKELDRAHMAQVQTLINEIRLNADNIRQKDDKILLLEDVNKKSKWWKFW